MIKKIIIGLLALILVAVGVGAIISGPANATGGDDCEPSDAWTETVFDHWQRYSWTGGPHESDDPPPFPSDDWQPNVQGDPHGVGVEGAYFRSHGNSGNGDWFYLEAVNTVIEHPAVECPPEQPDPKEYTTMDQKKDCDGIFLRLFDWSQPYVWDEQSEEWVLGEAVQVNDSGWLLVRELTEEERAELECDERPEQPEPEVTETSSTSLECDSDTQITTHVVTTTEYVWDENLNEWVLGEPTSVENVTEETVEVVPCDKPENPNIEQPEGDEEIVFQSFDGNGNLVEQRVAEPIADDAKQEGM